MVAFDLIELQGGDFADGVEVGERTAIQSQTAPGSDPVPGLPSIFSLMQLVTEEATRRKRCTFGPVLLQDRGCASFNQVDGRTLRKAKV
jgi:hypothetical protein